MIIAASLGADRGHPDMEKWFEELDPDEQARRKTFNSHFSSLHHKFRDEQPLSGIRDLVIHRTGVAPIGVTIRDRFGVVHEGGPLHDIPRRHRTRIIR